MRRWKFGFGGKWKKQSRWINKAIKMCTGEKKGRPLLHIMKKRKGIWTTTHPEEEWTLCHSAKQTCWTLHFVNQIMKIKADKFSDTNRDFLLIVNCKSIIHSVGKCMCLLARVFVFIWQIHCSLRYENLDYMSKVCRL